MKKEKIYIAGKVTGDPCYKMKFNAGVERLVELGWPDWKESTGARIERLVARVTMKWMIYIHPEDNKREQPKK